MIQQHGDMTQKLEIITETSANTDLRKYQMDTSVPALHACCKTELE